jgi:hypothetical protein
MEVFDIMLYLSIAIFLNIFIHVFANYSYRDLQVEDKIKKTTSLLIIVGIISVAVSFVLSSKKKIISNGFKYGGLLLILTAIVTSWGDIYNELKLIILGIIFIYLIIYSYKKETNIKDKILQKKIEK